MDIENLIVQCSGEVITASPVVLIDGGFSALRTFVNRWFAPLPVFKSLCRYNVVIARSTAFSRNDAPSVSIIVAARNEAGNIPALIDRVPQLADVQELIFIEGGSRDETWGVIQREISSRQSSRTALRAAQQTGKGKGDAVRLGFSMATGDILIILDADLSVMPEELPRFIDLMRTGKCEFANGSRLVYPMEKEAMQFLNLIGNRLFGIAFTYLLGQSVRDTLCGTKALWRRDYDRIAARRAFFGELDPFGDFDLLFGAARLNLRIRDVPVHYKERTYGSTNISRFRHGLLLLRMTALAARRLKFVPLRIEQP
jgi:glycosyltransferase involved in cell wall biosynthesis